MTLCCGRSSAIPWLASVPPTNTALEQGHQPSQTHLDGAAEDKGKGRRKADQRVDKDLAKGNVFGGKEENHDGAKGTASRQPESI